MITWANPGHIGHLEMPIVTWEISSVPHFIPEDTWKYLEILVDEEMVRKSKNLQRQTRNESLLQELASLHGTHVFRKFLEDTNRKKP